VFKADTDLILRDEVRLTHTSFHKIEKAAMRGSTIGTAQAPALAW